jgi:hypothetical protein
VVRRALNRDNRIAAVESAIVVSDDDRGLLTWTADGATVMRRTTLTGEPIRKMAIAARDLIPTMLTPTTWYGGGILVLSPPGAAHSVWWFFAAGGVFEGWYINLEKQLGRWHAGFDVQDQALDIWVDPDLSWKWKDEDEFAERTGHPAFWTAAEAPGIRAEGERVIATVESGGFPFDGTWTGFRADPQWTPATLRPDWDLPR